MSSRDGLARADVDTGLFADPKVKALARLQNDPVRTAATMTLYLATVLDSWAEDRRVAAVDAAPAWWLGAPTEWIADLTTVGLLDRRGCVPAAVLDRWMGPTRARMEAGRAGAEARWRDRNATARTPAMRPHSDRNANSQPASQPASTRARARERNGSTDSVESLRDVLRRTTGEPNIVTEREGS